MKKMFFLLLIFTMLVSCSSKETHPMKQNESSSQTKQNDKTITVLASRLSTPWSIQKLDNAFFISERTGTIAFVANGRVIHEEVDLQQPLSTAAEAGLLGFVLTPNFKDTGEAFAYYTYEKSEQTFNRIVRLKRNQGIWREVGVLIDEIPSGAYHHGGRLKIGPDGKLYATTGDAVTPEIAQDVNSLGGKILRMNLDGSIPNDNPIEDNYMYSFGHRNPQGMAWSPDGKMYASEHGPSANDEINEIMSNRNYGWPQIIGKQEQQNLVTPLFTSGDKETWAPSGMVYDENALYVAALRGTAILRFDLDNNRIERIVKHVGRIRDVWLDGDDLYFITNNTDGRGNPSGEDDQLLKISLNQSLK